MPDLSTPAFVSIAPSEYQARCARIELALFDVDGVLTDGRLYLGADGAEHKSFHTRDGQGLAMLRESGIGFGVISGRSSPAVQERLAALGATHIVQGCSDKRAAVSEILASSGLPVEAVSFMGDDLPDIPAMLSAGLAVAVADADPNLLGVCHWRTRTPGGVGAVREFCEDLLRARGALDQYISALIHPDQ